MDLRSRVSELEKEIEKLKRREISDTNARNYLASEIMDDKERLIFDFIKKDRGVSNETIVKQFNGKMARMTVFKYIGILKRKELIISEPNEKNRQTQSLFINNKNIILNVEREIVEFKDSLIKVLDKLDVQIKKGIINVNHQKYEDTVTILEKDYFTFISIYFSRAMLQWHKNIHERQKLFQLYIILIRNIIEIQERISKFVRGFVPAIPFYKEICTDDDDIPEQMTKFCDVGMEDEYDSLKSSLVRINYNYAKDRLSVADSSY